MKRGQFIMGSKAKELEILEEQIATYLEKNGDQLAEPVKAYLIFQDEEGYQRAINLDKKTVCFKTQTEVTLHGKPIYFKAAPEPSNIMWEN